MKQFAESFPEDISEIAVSQIPWGNNIVLLQKINHSQERLWYAAFIAPNEFLLYIEEMLLKWFE